MGMKSGSERGSLVSYRTGSGLTGPVTVRSGRALHTRKQPSAESVDG